MMKAWEDAVRRGDVEAVRSQIAAGADINARDQHGQTALMIAAHEGHAPVVSLLVEHGAGLNHTAKYGLSALMLAVIRGDAQIAATLVNAGADLTLRGTGAPGFWRKTALDLALAQGRTDIADVLNRGRVD
jgi:ankyrin repeat protein